MVCLVITSLKGAVASDKALVSTGPGSPLTSDGRVHARRGGRAATRRVTVT